MKSIVASNVEAIISERCLKQCAVAKKAGYSKQQFNAMLKGRKVIRDTDIIRISVALEVDANTLLALGNEVKKDAG